MSEQGTPMDSGSDLHERLRRGAPTWGELRAQTDHADKAYEYLSSAPFNGDPEVTKAMITAAEVHAKLALSDKVEELIATLKFCTNEISDSQAKLDADIQTAAHHLHRDAHHLHTDAEELKAHLRLVQEEKEEKDAA